MSWSNSNRNHAIAAAYASVGYTMQNIGDFFRLHYSRVSKIIQAADQAIAIGILPESLDVLFPRHSRPT